MCWVCPHTHTHAQTQIHNHIDTQTHAHTQRWWTCVLRPPFKEALVWPLGSRDSDLTASSLMHTFRLQPSLALGQWRARPHLLSGVGGRGCVLSCFPEGRTESSEILLSWHFTGREAVCPPRDPDPGKLVDMRADWLVSKMEIIISL